MSRGRKTRRAAAGFTLIELMVSVLIAAFTVLGLAGGSLAVMRANRVSEKLSHATALAQKQLAILKQQAGWGPLAAGNLPEEGFDVQWAPQGAGPETGTTIVRVTVSWTDQRTHTLEFETIVRDG